VADEYWYLWYEYRGFRILIAILLVGIIALLVWLLAFRPNHDDATVPVQPGGGPASVTQEDLINLSQQFRQPIYWAGTMPGTWLELTETDTSYAYIRYLSEDTPVGDPSPNFLTVGTYPSLRAYTNLRAYANHADARTNRIANGGLAVTVPGSPTSVYFAYPHEDVQVEVYDPDSNRALSLVKSGVVRPVTEDTNAAVPGLVPGASTTVAPTTTTSVPSTSVPTTSVPIAPPAPTTTVPGG
jgi:hypothetical protein